MSAYLVDIVKTVQCTEVRFASFISGGFTTMAVINPPESKLDKTHLCAMFGLVDNEFM